MEGEGDEARFYFLEMNTRLQVEHAVTESVTGVDLVRAQLLVAGGAPLPWRQADLTQRGHAIECRVYAEDPAHNFLPQAGRIALYREPAAPGIRIDSGVVEGAEVPVHYDPLIAKVIAHAETREAALARMVQTLRAYPILGVRTNIPFLLRVIAHPRFVAGAVDTSFVDAEMAALGESREDGKRAAALAIAATIRRSAPDSGATASARVPDPWETLRDWRA
jgi:acetyl/propionyl-CoA carboxylase alpha subunit